MRVHQHLDKAGLAAAQNHLRRYPSHPVGSASRYTASAILHAGSVVDLFGMSADWREKVGRFAAAAEGSVNFGP